ncbi:glutaminase A [Nocardioides campestrisoli]|uniref:glutaminase A n=1 Tax=Nocardioides campestrisoli TaxID=2736757 RepID=UPI0015E77736|nr:glutaminase A [Nocardioides campestrisoli]
MTQTGDLAGWLEAERERLLPERSGEVGDPSVDTEGAADHFALAVRTVEGELTATAEGDVEFAIQSVVKPFLYAVALCDRGEEVRRSIGVEPTGEPFDALVLEQETGRPPNPMVNAGALMAASLVAGSGVEERVARVLEVCSAAAGRDLHVDEQVVAAELEHADRNRALGYLMRGGGTLHCEVEHAVETLARVCSVQVTVADLATMGATLAGWGEVPGTSRRVMEAHAATEVLSVMATCGMYDGSGRWIHRAGMPAKSGVSGALLAVAPGRLGFAAWSPPLDEHGNSTRGMQAGEAFSEAWGLHPFAQVPRDTS